jgi:putative ABC transport system permease protein
VEALVLDIRYALRAWRRQPRFAALAIIALALGTGASTAIFTVVESVLLRPLPYQDPGRLVVTLHGSTASGPVSPADFLDYQRDATSFERLGAAQAWGGTLGDAVHPERISGLQVTPSLFTLLGVPPLAGRTFVEGDDQNGRARVVVLSHGLWQRRFGGDPAVVGRSISIDGQPFDVIGIMPAGFRFAPFWITDAEMWSPLSLSSRLEDRGGRSLRVFGRLKPGVTISQAQAELSGIAARLAADHPDTNTGLGITVMPLLDKVVAGIRPTLLALLTMVVLVLLIACANVSNALLARASGQQHEIALRLAIGASAARVVRQLLTESVLLSVTGSAAGLVLAAWCVNALLAMLPAGSLPRQLEVGFDLRVFAGAAAAALGAGVATGVAPALWLLRVPSAAALQGSARSTDAADRTRTRAAIVALQVALAVVLLVGAALMARTMQKLSAVDPGFRIDRVAVASVSVAGTPYADPARRDAMFTRIRERLARLPGVVAVGAINHLPLAGDLWHLGYAVDGRPTPPPGQRDSAVYRVVQPGYFAAMRLPVLRGRVFTENDRADTAPVAIVNAAMASRQWPGESPVGRRIHLPGPGNVADPITIVGVVANARQSDWTSAPDDEVYVAFGQRAGEFGLTSLTFVVRTSGDAAPIAAIIPAAVAGVDRSITVSAPTTMSQVVADRLWRERLTAILTGLFAAVALALAAIGIDAVVAYSVSRRVREFGVRLALGATRGDVLRVAVRGAIAPVTAGAAVGLVLAAAFARLVASLLFGVGPLDPWAIGSAAALLAVVAGTAAWLPARRASRLDPTVALRAE